MDNELAKELGTFIRTARNAQGLSTRELADAVGLKNMSQVVRLEQGQIASPKADLLGRIADVLHLPVADLMALAGYPTTTALPALRPYMRAKYKDLPPEAVDEVEAFITNLQHRHGLSNGPQHGEDER